MKMHIIHAYRVNVDGQKCIKMETIVMSYVPRVFYPGFFCFRINLSVYHYRMFSCESRPAVKVNNTHQNGIVDAMCFSMTVKTHTFENTLMWKKVKVKVKGMFIVEGALS